MRWWGAWDPSGQRRCGDLMALSWESGAILWSIPRPDLDAGLYRGLGSEGSRSLLGISPTWSVPLSFDPGEGREC